MISFIVCSNGYGHLKRVLLVIAELLKQDAHISITLFCPASHLAFAKQEVNFSHAQRIFFETSASQNEISWLSEEGVSIKRYNEWCQELSTNVILRESRLIVSDNHVAPLNIFSNVLLMGSFLWHDVVAFSNTDVVEIAFNETQLLGTKKPYMLCLKSMVMPAVKNQTNAITLPWFVERYADGASVEKTKSILITGGGTALLNTVLADICLAIAEKEATIAVFADTKIFHLLKDKGDNCIKKFSFSDEDFSQLTAIVCRPGIGILTDCVRYTAVPITINDGYNKEINHNAAQVRALGIGHSINSYDYSADGLADKIIHFLSDTAQIEACMEKLTQQDIHGAEKAAKFIINQLN